MDILSQSYIHIAPRFGLVVEMSISSRLTIFFARLGGSFSETDEMSSIQPTVVLIELISIYGNLSLKIDF